VTAPQKVELLTATGCNRCQQLKAMVKRLVAEFAPEQFRYHEVDVVENIDYAVALGVLSTPAIAIAGTLVFTAPPTEKKLRKALEACVKSEENTRENW
jgi:thioredoxin